MARILKFIKPYWWAALIAPLLMTVEVWMDIQLPTLMSTIIDEGVANGDTQFIISTGVRMAVYAVIGIIGGFGCVVFSTIAAAGFATDLREKLFSHVQTFTFNNLDRFHTGSLITRLTNDVTQLQNMVMAALRILVRAPLLCIGGIYMAVMLNAQLALIFLVSAPILVAAITFVLRRGFPLFRKMQGAMDRVNTVMQENLSGVRVVKAFVREDFERKRFDDSNVGLREINLKAVFNMSLLHPVMNLVMNFSIIAVLWLGGGLVEKGGMQIGQVMAFINYMTQILFSLMMSAFIMMNISRAKASADRLNEILDEKPEIFDPENPVVMENLQGKVTFENVTAEYFGSTGEPALKNVSFTVSPGETLAILGSTGSGKTTLVSLIPRLYDPTGGRILLDDVDIRDYLLDDLRKAVSVVTQQSLLFSGSVKDNLHWGNDDATDEMLEAAVKAAQAYEFVNAMPDRFDTRLERAGVNLSGGQKQRLSIARSLVRDPAVLILDDSTSAVDMNTEALIQEALRVRRGTVIIIAQRISSVMDADRILVLDGGEVSAIGTHEDLLRNSEIYREICASQLGQEAV